MSLSTPPECKNCKKKTKNQKLCYPLIDKKYCSFECYDKAYHNIQKHNK